MCCCRVLLEVKDPVVVQCCWKSKTLLLHSVVGSLRPVVMLQVHNLVNVQVSSQHRLSGQSYESGVSSRQSYHSTSSSSLGSLDRLEESGYTSTINVAELFHAGMQVS